MVVGRVTFVGIGYDSDGKFKRLKLEEPEPEVKKDWVPRLGKDTRDLRDPEKVGKQHLRNVARRKRATTSM